MFEREVQVMNLTENERVNRKIKAGDLEEGKRMQNWSEYLIQLGEGKIEKDEDGLITIPPENLAESDTITDFVEEIYPTLHQGEIDYKTIVNTDFKNLQPFSQKNFTFFQQNL